MSLMLPVSKLRLRGFKSSHPRSRYELMEKTVLRSVMERKEANVLIKGFYYTLSCCSECVERVNTEKYPLHFKK